MSRQEIGRVGFTIEGEYLTDLARAYVREGNWRKGYTLLMEGLEGIEAQAVLDILSGKTKLVGVNELNLAPDTAQDAVKDSLDYQFRHCFQFEGRVFRAYGYVQSFQRSDWWLANKIAQGDDAAMLRNKLWRLAADRLDETPTVKAYNSWERDYGSALRYRSAFYAQDRERDISVAVNLPKLGNYPVLFEQLEADVPLWYQLPKLPCDVVREAFEADELPDLFRAEVADEDAWMAVPASRAGRLFLSEPQADDEEDVLTEEAAEAEAEQRVQQLRQQIVLQADDDAEYGWRELKEFDQATGRNVALRVPGRAFICAALSRARASHLMPDYTPVCYSGMKMLNDDPFHTDAWVGAGQSVDTAYDMDLPEQRLFMSALYDLQREMLSFSFDVLSRGDKSFVSGSVIHDPALAQEDKILVLACADPVYADAAARCAGVIVETGSKLAHMVIVSREAAVPVIRQAKALQTFKPGRHVSINLTEGVVNISPV